MCVGVLTQQSRADLECRIKDVESEKSMLVERCRVLQVDCTSQNAELQRLTTSSSDVETELTHLTEQHNSLNTQYSQVFYFYYLL